MNEKKTQKKDFFHSRTFLILLSFLLAVIFWGYVTGTEGVTVTRSFSGVKVDFIGADALRDSAGLVVTDKTPTAVNVRLTGLRRNIGKISSDDLSATVDLSKINSDGHYTLLYTLKYPAYVNADDVEVESGGANYVTVTIERYITRSVEVKGKFTGNTAEGFVAEESPSFDPLSVKVSGPKSQVDNIDCAWVSITRENVDETLSYSTMYSLLDAEGNEIDDSALSLEIPEVNVTLKVLTTKLVSLKIAIQEGGGAKEENAIVSVEPAGILLAGQADILEGINQIVVDSVKLSALSGPYDAEDVVIPIPNDTVNLSGIYSAAVHLELQGLVSAPYTVNSEFFSASSVPDGYIVEFVTESLPVSMRGPEESMAALKENNIRVVADCTDVAPTAGSVYSVPVKISADGLADVGAVGEYKIYIKLAKS